MAMVHVRGRTEESVAADFSLVGSGRQIGMRLPRHVAFDAWKLNPIPHVSPASFTTNDTKNTKCHQARRAQRKIALNSEMFKDFALRAVASRAFVFFVSFVVKNS
jgi:hypothetical protein